MSEKSKKIAFLVYNLEHGGAEKVCTLLCNELLKRNVDVELWVVNYRETPLTMLLNSNIRIVSFGKKHTRNCFRPLLKTLKQRKPETLLIFHTELAILALILRRIFLVKVTIIVRNINTLSQFFKNSNGSLRRYFTLMLSKFAMRNSDRIIAQSTGMKEDLLEFFQIENSKIETIFNPAIALKVNGFSPMQEVSCENEFLFVGRLNHQKGLTQLIKAFEMAYKCNPNIHLTLVGEGEEENRLKKMVKEMGLSGSITFVGYRAETAPYYNRAKATVLTSLFEGFPNVLVESISVGTPVISFDCPSGPRDIIVSGVNGILVENLDIFKFAKAMLSVANDEANFIKNDVINSANKFSINTTVSKYLKVLTEKHLGSKVI